MKFGVHLAHRFFNVLVGSCLDSFPGFTGQGRGSFLLLTPILLWTLANSSHLCGEGHRRFWSATYREKTFPYVVGTSHIPWVLEDIRGPLNLMGVMSLLVGSNRRLLCAGAKACPQPVMGQRPGGIGYPHESITA